MTSTTTTTATNRDARIAANLAARAARTAAANTARADSLTRGQSIAIPVASPGAPHFGAGSVGIVDQVSPNPAGAGVAIRVALDFGRVRTVAVAADHLVRLV